MPFKKVTTEFVPSLKIGNGKPDRKGNPTIKSVTGWLLGLKVIESEEVVGRGKNKKVEIRYSYIYKLAGEKTDKLEVWGNGSINYILLEDDCKPEKPKIKKELLGKLIRLSYDGIIPARGVYSPGTKVKVEVDDARKLPKDAGRKKF